MRSWRITVLVPCHDRRRTTCRPCIPPWVGLMLCRCWPRTGVVRFAHQAIARILAFRGCGGRFTFLYAVKTEGRKESTDSFALILGRYRRCDGGVLVNRLAAALTSDANGGLTRLSEFDDEALRTWLFRLPIPSNKLSHSFSCPRLGSDSGNFGGVAVRSVLAVIARSRGMGPGGWVGV